MHQPSFLETTPNVDDTGSRTVELSQYLTPRWVSEMLLAELGPLTSHDHVLEPQCGRGSWLHAVPLDVAATGVEIDPVLAEIAARDTGRRIIVGDFATANIDFEPTVAVGNPPFTSEDIEITLTRLRRLMTTPGSRIGLILPVLNFSFAQRTLDLLRGFDATPALLPRDLYPRISVALMFLKLTRSKQEKLTGFLLYGESVAIRSMRAQYRSILESGRKPIWREILEMALTACGGEASLTRVYEIVENFRPSETRFWRDAIRREAGEHFERVRDGVFRIPTSIAA